MRARQRGAVLAIAALVALGPGRARGDEEHAAAPSDLPPLRYALPEAGSYALPPIDRVSEHSLLDAAGERAPLLAIPPGACAVVGFVYLSCTDATGCPLSLASIQRLDRALARRPALGRRVRLVSVSFDPERDGPEQMAGLRRHMAPKGDWRFLTAPDAGALAPVLEDFGQDVVPLIGGDDVPTGVLRHVAKVFLVDSGGAVRNIYSTGFLDYRLVLRDIETLLGETTPSSHAH